MFYNDDIFTGGLGERSSDLSDILQYNPTSNTWEEVGQMKDARARFALGLLEDVSVICP